MRTFAFAPYTVPSRTGPIARPNRNREIEALIHALELEARFERRAARFEAKADATGNDTFQDHADRARAQGAALKEKFLARLDGS